MGFIKKYAIFLTSFCLISLYLVFRFTNILALPIFTDEAIYIRWAQIAANDASWRFISLTDGKQPLFIWIAIVFLKFIHEPLLAVRLVSVLAGFLSMIGIFFLSSEIFKNRTIGFLTSLLYVLYPFALVYDRLALYDSMVAMFIIWSLYFEVLLVRYLRLDLALILGMIIGGGMLTKTNADFALAFLPFTLFLFDFKDKHWRPKLFRFAIYSLTAAFIAEIIYAVLRLSPFFYIIDQKNALFVYPLKEWLMHPFTYFVSNFSALVSWLFGYMTIPFAVLVAASFFVSKKFLREKLLLFIAFLAPFIYLAFFGKTIYPRFLLFMTMPLLVLGAYSLYTIENYIRTIWVRAVVVLVFILSFIVTDYVIITDFPNAAIPQSDRGQFITGWPSGLGVAETVAFLKEKSANQKIYVGTEGTFGLMPYALEIYLHDDRNIKIVGFWPINDQPPKEAIDASKDMPTYFVFYQSCPSCKQIGIAPSTWPVTKVLQFEKLEKGSFYTLYQFK